jgi:hypothetical protein
MLVDNTENNTLYYKSLYKPKAILHEVDLNNTKGSAKVVYLECITKMGGSLSIKSENITSENITSENITSRIKHISPYDEGWLFAVLYHLLNDSTKLT